MKGGNTSEIQGFDYENVGQYGLVDMKGGKKKKANKSQKFDDFDFEKEWKEFETSYNQKYGGASKKKKPAKKASSAKKPAKKGAKKPTKRKTQRGGDESGATFAPAQFFDEKATMSAPSSDQSKGSLMNGLYPHSPNNPVVDQTGGAKKKGSKAKKDTKKTKTATKTTKPKKDSKKDSKKTKTTTKSNNHKATKKDNILEKIKKFFSM